MPSQKETLIHQLRDVQLSCLARLKAFQNNQLINDQAATDAKQQIEDLEVDLHSALLWADELSERGCLAIRLVGADTAGLEKQPAGHQ